MFLQGADFSLFYYDVVWSATKSELLYLAANPVCAQGKTSYWTCKRMGFKIHFSLCSRCPSFSWIQMGFSPPPSCEAFSLPQTVHERIHTISDPVQSHRREFVPLYETHTHPNGLARPQINQPQMEEKATGKR